MADRSKGRASKRSVTKEQAETLDRIAERHRKNPERLIAYLEDQQSTNCVADKIRQAILDSDLTRYQIAKASGVDQGTLSRFVHGERTITLETAEKLCPVLGLDLDVRTAKRSARK